MKKRIVLLVALLALPMATFAQSIFDKFEESDNVTTVVVTKKMFELFSRIDAEDKEAKEFMELTKSLHNLRVFVTENKSVAADMKSTVDKYLKSSAMEELMRVKDKDANVKFYIRQGKDADHVKELLMFVDGINGTAKMPGDRKVETVLLSLTGDIDLNKISTLTKKMNLPSELDKAGNK